MTVANLSNGHAPRSGRHSGPALVRSSSRAVSFVPRDQRAQVFTAQKRLVVPGRPDRLRFFNTAASLRTARRKRRNLPRGIPCASFALARRVSARNAGVVRSARIRLSPGEQTGRPAYRSRRSPWLKLIGHGEQRRDQSALISESAARMSRQMLSASAGSLSKAITFAAFLEGGRDRFLERGLSWSIVETFKLLSGVTSLERGIGLTF